MSTFHTQWESLCHLSSMRIKEKPLEENAIFLHTETEKPAYPPIFNLINTTS